MIPLRRISKGAVLMVCLLMLAMPVASLTAAALVEVTELLAHPDHYNHQVVTVSGRVSSFQLATNRDGQPALGFLLQDTAGTVKVVGLGKADVEKVTTSSSRASQPVTPSRSRHCLQRNQSHVGSIHGKDEPRPGRLTSLSLCRRESLCDLACFPLDSDYF
ncbi:MAG: hypothetical protein QM771_18010 [Nitrospira sp.]